MYKGKKILAIIPARGGSKRVPNKNIHPFGGKPLLQWTVSAAKESKYCDKIVVSSDDQDILNLAKQNLVEPLLRPAELCTDTSSGLDPIFHALSIYGEDYDYVILLQPTSPLRHSGHIQNAVEKVVDGTLEYLVSVRKSREIVTHMLFESQGKLDPVLNDPRLKDIRSQDVPQTFVLNGAIYIANIKAFESSRSFVVEGKTAPFFMEDKVSIDIDTLEDFERAESFLKELPS